MNHDRKSQRRHGENMFVWKVTAVEAKTAATLWWEMESVRRLHYGYDESNSSHLNGAYFWILWV